MITPNRNSGKKNLVIYTAIFGDYDHLIEPPQRFEGCDFICFTDQKSLSSDIWEIRYIEHCDLPPNLMNRRYKILPHLFCSEYEKSLYVDANIELLRSPLDLSIESLKYRDIAVPSHPIRKCIYDEAEAVVLSKDIDPEVVQEQINYYKQEGFPAGFGLCEMNIIFRNHNKKEIIVAMELWFDMLLKYTARDQLSFFYVVWKRKLEINKLDLKARQPNRFFFVRVHRNVSSFRKIKNKIKRKLYLTVSAL